MDRSAGLAEQLASGDRRALARAITLVESTRPDHRRVARELLTGLEPRDPPALRLGMTGTPGVGKSSLIERLGLMLADEGRRIDSSPSARTMMKAKTPQMA